MKLVSLSVRDFRNLAAVDLEPSPRATILVGENGQGKTNLLEAIYVLATLKPLRAARLAELVRFGEERAQVAADFEGPGGIRRAAVQVQAGGRAVFLDGKPQEKLDSYFEGLAAVCFAPDDLLLVKAGPEGRRRFLDRAAFNRWPAVLGEARDFVRALRARNAALRTAPPGCRGLVPRAARPRGCAPPRPPARPPRGARAPSRARVRGDLRARTRRRRSSPTGPRRGCASLGSEGELAAPLAEILEARLPRDREKGYTSAGPHMDDLALALGGRGARSYGSQGQQRALVLALKIAEIENLRAALGRPPLLLLDDVSSELDPAKNRYLLAYLAALSAQVFLTSTDRRLLEPAAGPESRFFRVEKGVVTPLVS